MDKSIKNIYKIHSIFVLFIIFLAISCSDTKKSGGNKLLTIEDLKSKEIKYLKKKNILSEDEKIAYVYSLSNLKKEAVVLTDKRLVVFNKDSANKELLENIFDISILHSEDININSTVTIYRRDDTEFSVKFTGASDIDEKFFLELKRLWRLAIIEKQSVVGETNKPMQ